MKTANLWMIWYALAATLLVLDVSYTSAKPVELTPNDFSDFRNQINQALALGAPPAVCTAVSAAVNGLQTRSLASPSGTTLRTALTWVANLAGWLTVTCIGTYVQNHATEFMTALQHHAVEACTSELCKATVAAAIPG